MNKPFQYVALVSLGDRVLHALGPFASPEDAGDEGRVVAQGVDMFAPVGSQESAAVRVLTLYANLGAMLPG